MIGEIGGNAEEMAGEFIAAQAAKGNAKPARASHTPTHPSHAPLPAPSRPAPAPRTCPGPDSSA